MEESQSMHIDGEEENGDEFYDRIEAPKFVDLNAPDSYHAGDDRYWFCLRVGCDQKHEEELDSEAIYKSFILRVMAARSPNIRLRKALYTKDSSANLRCPQSVPSKPLKHKVSRLSLLSSMSKKLVGPKVKAKTLNKPGATPNVKAKQSSVLAKALTTPSKKKQLPNPDAFRSVRNPKAATIAVPNNKVVAKALIFNSPKKSGRVKTSLELKTPVKTLCAGIKKLEIAGREKNVLGYNRPMPSDVSRKQPKGREVKSRVYNGLLPQNHKVPVTRSYKHLKKKNEGKNSHKHHDPVPQEAIEDGFSDMEIEEGSRAGSLEVCSISKSEENENRVEKLSDFSTIQLTTLPNSEEGTSGDAYVPKIQDPSGESGAITERSEEEKIKSCLEMGTNKGEQSDDKEHVVTCESDAKETVRKAMESDKNKNICEETPKLSLEGGRNKTKGSGGDKENNREVMDSDDKENTSASDNNRGLKSGHTNRKTLGKHEIPTQKITGSTSKTSKLSSTTIVTGTQGMKHIRPRPTNPKPFRLRTDERRILKEANSDKKPHVAPLKEIKSGPRLPGRSLQKKHKNALQRKEKCPEQTEDSNGMHKGSETISVQKGQPRKEKCLEQPEDGNDMHKCSEIIRILKSQPKNGTSSLKISNEKVRRQFSTTPQRHTISLQQELVTPRRQYSQDKASQKIRTTDSLLVKRAARPKEASSGAKHLISFMTPGQLGKIKETSPTFSRHKEAAKRSESGRSLATNKPSVSAASRPSLQGKKLTTIAKEPNFHTIHVPKSCTRRVA